MSTRRNPLYVFKDKDSRGIYDIPLESMIQVIDVDGNKTPSLTQLIGKDGLGPSSTIDQYLASNSASITNYVTLDKDTTYGTVTNTTDGLMSSVDFNKLTGIEDLATVDQNKADIDLLGIDAATVTGCTIGVSVPTTAVFTDTIYDDTILIGDIATNTADIATNVIDIATNAANIAANTAAINANTTDISSNTTAIIANATAISDNSDDLDLKANIADPIFTGLVTTPNLLVNTTFTTEVGAAVLIGGKLDVNGGATIALDTTIENLIVNGTMDGPLASTGSPGLIVQGAAVVGIAPGTNDAAVNEAKINELLASLRVAKIIEP